MLTPDRLWELWNAQGTDDMSKAEAFQFARAIEAEVRKDDEALIAQMLDHIERNTCTHEETHRGGVIWEICDGCGAKWADDEGGKPPFAWPKVVLAARARLEEPPCAPKP